MLEMFECILIATDNPSNERHYRELLETFIDPRTRVVGAATGADVRKKIKKFDPSLLLVELHLPGKASHVPDATGSTGLKLVETVNRKARRPAILIAKRTPSEDVILRVEALGSVRMIDWLNTPASQLPSLMKAQMKGWCRRIVLTSPSRRLTPMPTARQVQADRRPNACSLWRLI